MVPHQIYQALSQQRSQELKATGRRHELTAAAELTTARPSESWSHLKSVAARLVALVRPASRTANSGPASSAPRTKSQATSTSTAGPMGCIA